MNKGLTRRRWRVAITALALYGAASALPFGPPGGPGVALAAEANEEPAEEPSPGGNAEDASGQSESAPDADDGASKDAPSKPDDDESEEIFVPSEDISEDIDVPFPVDI